MPAFERQNSNDSLLSGSVSLSRSRTWSDDVLKHWSMPVLPAESFDQRLKRYTEYFSLQNAQVKHVYRNMLREIEKGLHDQASELRALETSITGMPTGNERGVIYAVDFSGATVHAVRAKLEGIGRMSLTEHRLNIREESTCLPKGLLDKQSGALELFDSLAKCVRELMETVGDLGPKKPIVEVGFSIAFPISSRSLGSAVLEKWTKGFETGRMTDDPVEGLDLATLLDMAFWRAEINARTVCVVNSAVASLVACEYERPRKLPPCTVAFLSGVGVNGVYVEPNFTSYGFKGKVLNTEIGRFDAGLPVTDIDLEIDFADEGGHGSQMLEKMIGGGYLGEICRRLIVKVYQSEAPPLAWARQTMPTAAAALVVSDSSPELTVTNQLVRGLWQWETTLETRQIIRKLFTLVFDRSATLSAVCIAALAKSSKRLQAAMGGVAVAVDAVFHASNPWYSESVRMHLHSLLGETSKFVHLYVLHDGPAKGAALLAYMAQGNNR